MLYDYTTVETKKEHRENNVFSADTVGRSNASVRRDTLRFTTVTAGDVDDIVLSVPIVSRIDTGARWVGFEGRGPRIVPRHRYC